MDWKRTDVDPTSTVFRAASVVAKSFRVDEEMVLEVVQNVFQINMGGLGPLAIEDEPVPLLGGACGTFGRVVTFLVLLILLWPMFYLLVK